LFPESARPGLDPGVDWVVKVDKLPSPLVMVIVKVGGGEVSVVDEEEDVVCLGVLVVDDLDVDVSVGLSDVVVGVDEVVCGVGVSLVVVLVLEVVGGSAGGSDVDEAAPLAAF
jgi:hypothetical protein